MSMLSKEVVDLINGPVVGVLGTAAADGTPNAVPVGAKMVVDDKTVMVSDQFFKKTLANLRENPKVTLSVWEDRFGVQVKGTASYETEGERFERYAAIVNARFEEKGLPMRSKGICFIEVDAVFSTTPGEHAGERLCD